MPTGSWLNLWVRYSQWLTDRLFDGVTDLVSRIRAPLILFEIPTCHSPDPFPLSSNAAHKSVLWMGLEKWVSWEDWNSLTYSYFPPWEKSQTKKNSLGPKLCHLGGKVMVVKLYCSSHSLQWVQTCIVLLQWYSGTSPLETSHKGSLFHGRLFWQYFPGQWPRGTGASS